jgi:uncharacterized protein with NRDE domain
MCLAVIAVDAHPRYALVLAANRDEYHARPAAPASWSGDVLAGRDLMAGGTWLAVRRDGRMALVTNVRDGKAQDPAKSSRGELPLLALGSPGGIDGARYNGFNLVAGDASGLEWTSNRSEERRRIDTGVHGLSNAALDARWPKVVRTEQRLASWLRGDAASLEPLFDALGDRDQAPDALLPATGVPLAWERILSAPFILGERYGTRCSTVLAVDRERRAWFVERTFAPDGTVTNEAAFEWAL